MRLSAMLAMTLALAAGPIFAEALDVCAAGPAAPAPLPRVAAAIERGDLAVLVVGSSSTTGFGVGGAAAAYPARTEAILASRLGEAGRLAAVTVIARGRNGENAAGALKRLAAELATFQPDLLVWQVGTNDARGRMALERFAALLESGLDMAEAAGADAVLLDPQFYPGVAGDQRYQSYVRQVAETGARRNLPVIQRYARLRAVFEAEPAAFEAWLAADRFHMSEWAHACLAADLAATILAGAAAAD